MSEHSSTPSRPASPLGPLPVLSQPTPFRFNWERRKGPASISETTEGRALDHHNALPRVDLPNASVYNLASLPQDWSSSSQGFNAISNVLNSPHKSQAPPKAHSSLPFVAPTVLPRVKRRDFDPYLRAIAPEWERFVQSTNPPNEGLDPSTPRVSSEIPFTPRTPRFTKLLTPLNTVPSVFFQPDFDLGNSVTFDAVTERKNGDQHASDPSSLSYSLPLLEKLSHHADTIEQHLVREISIRSTSFFAALTNLQDLQTESEQCLDRISKLRGLLNDLDENGAKRGLEIVRKENRLLNLATVNEGVRELGAVVEMTGVARGLVGAGQWGEALDVIHSIDTLWNPPPDAPPKPVVQRRSRQTDEVLSPLPPTPESPSLEEEGSSKRLTAPSIPLSSLAGFSSLPSHLQVMNTEITSSLTSDLVTALKVDLLDRVNANPDSSKSPIDVNSTLKDRLRPLVRGLLRTNGIREATISWGEVVTVEVRGIVQRHLPSFDSDDDEKNSKGGTSALLGLLRSMTQAEFSSIISQVYTSLLRGIEGLQIQSNILINVLQSQKSIAVSADVPPIQEDLSDILSSTVDLSNKLAAKVIGYRSEQHAQLDLPSFLVFFNLSWDFVIKCEVICRRMIMGLRGVILGQAKLFLQVFHQSRINQSAKLVEDEQWNQMEVPSTVQHAADVLVDSAVRDSPDLIIGGKFPPQPPLSPSMNGAASPTLRKANGSIAPSSKYIRIEERPYFCVSATGAVLGLLLEYLKLVVNLPMLNTDTMSRVIEFLKAFNSRTCQVVLGAGAMRSAGLRNITAKHLALASQSLSIMVALIPYVRETFRRHLSPNQAVMLVEFDKLKRDFQEHQNEIHSKLIAIMGDRISAHVKSLQAVNWEIPREGNGVNDYMELLIKETVTLHKVLSRYLSSPIVEYVMSQVFAAINHRLSEEYAKIELQSQEAKDRMLADTQFLHQKLSVLKNVSAPTNMLETLVAEKTIPRKSAVGNFRATGGPNERIRGLLSRRDSSKPDKPLPSPVPTPLSLALPTSDTADDLGGDSDQVIPPPRGSSRSPALQGYMRAGVPIPSDSNGLRGNGSQSDEAFQETLDPVSSAPSLMGASRDSPEDNDHPRVSVLPNESTS